MNFVLGGERWGGERRQSADATDRLRLASLSNPLDGEEGAQLWEDKGPLFSQNWTLFISNFHLSLRKFQTKRACNWRSEARHFVLHAGWLMRGSLYPLDRCRQMRIITNNKNNKYATTSKNVIRWLQLTAKRESHVYLAEAKSNNFEKWQTQTVFG